MSLASSFAPARGVRLGLAEGLAEAAALALLYASTVAIGFALLVLLFKAGVLGAVGVLFYRGVLLIGVAGWLTLGGLMLALGRAGGRHLRPRDAFGATAVSLAFNLSFLVLMPVTVDRSITIFMLGQMNAHPGRAYTPQEMTALFTSVYVGEDRQIDRRLVEQSLSGDVEDLGGRYRISARGQALIGVSRAVAWMFDGDTRFVSPAPRPPPPQPEPQPQPRPMLRPRA